MNQLRALFALACLPLAACLAAPPSAQVETVSGVVRAESPLQAGEVGVLLERLQPELLEMLPGSREVEGLEVWLQEQPNLYASPGEAAHDAEGLWAESHNRILLSENADDLERTLAHELVHAHLGREWQSLPGTLEEGLCDYLSARLAPEGAPRLRAGRLSSAALACGGIRVEMNVSHPEADHMWSARITLSGADLGPDPQRGVFRLAAGLSTTRVSSTAKRSYYGLAYLVVERIARRRTLAGLYGLCRRAKRADHSNVPYAWLLDAADLEDDEDSFRRAAIQEMGTEEFVALVEMHPTFVVDALRGLLQGSTLAASPDELAELQIQLRLVEGDARIDLADEPALLRRVLASL